MAQKKMDRRKPNKLLTRHELMDVGFMPGSAEQKIVSALNRFDPHNNDPLDDKRRVMITCTYNSR